MCQPAAILQTCERLGDQILAVGRVQKHQVERPACRRPDGAKVGGVAPPDAGGAGQAQRLDILALKRPAIGAVIHQEAPARALADGLDSQGPSAGEQVQHGGTFKCKANVKILVPQHVENGLAGAVRGGAHAHILRRHQPPPPQCPACYSHC